MSLDPERVREFLAELEVLRHQMDLDADAYIVLVIDTEFGRVTEARGEYATPEEALVAAGRMDANPHAGLHPADGDPGWLHIVVPFYRDKR